ncbi:MAG: N-acetyltransferase [Burkholderiales bacterium]|uniref:GNAT family N-acetyltransferase n=1 Tax=Roseateles sp. TaxID=1971397 RepID=UPI000FAA9C72|nr:MAG: N-acetyltransferase [Burkholderiales bacterium]
MSDLTLRPLDPDRDLADLRDLWHEYLEWGNDELQRHYGLRMGAADAMVADGLSHLDEFAPPRGCLLLAHTPAGLMGSIALRPSAPGAGELKRLYVRPPARGLGLGQALVTAALQRAREAGYLRLRLDSARFMASAHALYRQHGFTDCEPYAESEVPPPYWPHWVFMQLSLTDSA